jgi:hypothetical protein
MSFSLALADEKDMGLVRVLADEVSPVSNLAVGGHGAIAMRDVFERTHIEVLEDFAALDHKLDRLMRQPLSRD